jgi:hypothetical protein
MYLFYGCSSIKIEPCISQRSQEEIESFIIPVKVGNKWIYKFTEKNVSKKVSYTIVGMEEIFYNDKSGKKSINAYKIQDDSDLTKSMSYYWKCDSTVQLLIINNLKDKKVIDQYYYPENPPVEYEEKKNSKLSILLDSYEFWQGESSIIPNTYIVWKSPENTIVPAGSFSCYVQEYSHDPKNSSQNKTANIRLRRIGIQSYYCKGVGLVKLVNFNDDGNILSVYELESYSLK